ncbi:MAG TPA: N-acetylglucosamine-6-phosphate deacetylase [Chloroflexota bacterium]|nr:N-acetylglucosamine-6-phosphate deacetylase [Chloroflexota bacterium]
MSASHLVLRARRILTPLEEITDGAVEIIGEKIRAVGPAATIGRPAGARFIECGDATIVPGFIDLHIHGSGGYSVMDGPEAVAAVSRVIAAHGVTAWLPTLTPRATLGELIDRIRACCAGGAKVSGGAEPVGLHLEGPFLSPRRPGAIRSEWFRAPSVPELDQLLAAGQGQVRLVTLAPELPGGLDLVRHLVERTVTVSIGHSDASHEEALAAIAAGVRHATHMFNAMRGFQHRAPGVVGAVLASPTVVCELIADGVHVDPLAMRLLIQATGWSRIAVITDAVAPAGLGDGAYEFEGRPIVVREGRATLADGTIAGSVATFDANLRRVARLADLDLRAVIAMATIVPARQVHLDDRKGSLSGGRDADLVVLDVDLRVKLTVARGAIVFNALGTAGHGAPGDRD